MKQSGSNLQKIKFINDHQEKHFPDTDAFKNYATWEWDLVTNKIYWSTEVYEILDYKPDKVIPSLKALFKRIHPQDSDKVKFLIQDRPKDSLPIIEKFRVILPDDSIRTILSCAKYGYNFSEKRNNCLFGIIQDVTECKTIETNSNYWSEKLNNHVINWGNIESDLRKYQKVVTAAREFLSIVDSSYTYQFINHYYLDKFKLRYDEIVGHTIAELHGQERFEEFIKADIDKALSGEEVHLKHWIQLPDQKRYMDVIYSPIRRLDGEIDSVVISARDITDEFKFLTSLQHSNDLKGTILNTSLDSIITINNKGEVQEFNPSAEIMFGYSFEDIKGKNVADLIIPEEFRDRHRNGFQHFLETGENKLIGKKTELDAVRSSGEIFPIEMTLTEIPVEKGRFFTAFIRDISERVKAERKLVESEERFRKSFDNAPFAMGLGSKEGKVIQVNQALMDLLGYGEEEVIGKDFREFIHPDDVEKSSENIKNLIAGNIDQYRQVRRFQHKQGHYIWAEVNVAVINDINGKPDYVVNHLRNVTEKLQAEKLQETQRVILEQITTGESQQEILNNLCLMFESMAPTDAKAFLLLSNPEDKKLRVGAAPSLSETVVNFFEGFVSGDCNASCGTAAHRGEKVIVEDVSMSPLWSEFREFAIENNILACWSTPFMSEKGEVLGTFAISLPRPTSPTKYDIARLEMAGYLASITVERVRAYESLRESETRFRSAFGNAPMGTALVDKQGVVLQANSRSKFIIGFSPEEIIGRSIADVTHPDDVNDSIDKFRQLMMGEIDAYQIEKRYRHKQGHYVWCRLSISSVKDENSNVSHAIAHIEDITERIESEVALRLSEEKFRNLFDENPCMYFMTDFSGHVMSVNKYGAHELGYETDEIIGRSLFCFSNNVKQFEVVTNLKKCIDSPEEVHRWEMQTHRKDGTDLWVKVLARVIDNEFQDRAILVVCEDMTNAHQLSERLEYQATHDGLTDLINRYEFEVRLKRALHSAKTDNVEHVLCYLDLDRFKIINDTCGHMAGDELLRNLSQLLSKHLRSRDSLARLGGDEFGLLIENCSINKALKIVQKIKKGVTDFIFIWKNQSFKIGASVGMVQIDKHSESISNLLMIADHACYIAKDKGRNRIHIHQQGDTEIETSRNEMLWTSRIHEALEQDRFTLFYQSIIPLNVNNNDQGLHLEVLLRMEDETGNIVTPDIFIPVAERYDLITEIDKRVVNMTFNWLRSDAQLLDKLFMCSINLSGQSIADDKLLKHIIKQLNKYNIPENKICFEITETSAIANIVGANKFIKTLKDKGCKFALDDFGSGLSSFGYLKTLPVDFLKIDGSFVKDIHNDESDLAIVKSINEVGRALNKQTVAEFVENDSISKILMQIGVDYAQGYGIERPRRVLDLNKPEDVKIA